MATGIESVKLGRTGRTVTRIGIGTSAIAGMPDTYGYSVSDDQARTTLRAVFAGPVNFLDTSRGYGRGRAEQRIGAVIREMGGLPLGFVLSTKLDRNYANNHFGAAEARRSLEESLEALGLDRIQIMHLHDPEYVPDLTEVMGRGGAIDELFKMKEEGIVGSVGLAAGDVDVMMPMLRGWDFDVMLTHNRFTLVNRNAEAMIDYCVSKGTAVLNAAPFGSGILAKGTAAYKRYAYRDAPEKVLAPIRKIEAICERYGVPIGAVALQFSLREPRITATILGITRPERIKETLDWANWPVPASLWEEVSALPFSTDNPQE
jgi:D-threo-aldose 1-dehydrogenase